MRPTRQVIIATRPFIDLEVPRPAMDPWARERGSAVVVAIVAIMIIAMISAAIVANTQRTRDVNKTRSDRVSGLGPADSGLSSFRFGLEAGLINDSRNPKWVPNRDLLARILNNADGSQSGEVLDNAQMRQYGTVDASIPAAGNYRVTVRQLRQAGDRVYDYWQIYKVEEPDPASGKDLRVWFRAWTGGTNPRSWSDARLVIGTFRQGRFSDFQLLSNAPIRLENGGGIFGPVHSNGDSDGSAPPAGVPAGATVYTAPGARITCPAGGSTITTGIGTIAVQPAACRPRGGVNATNRFISFQSLQRTFVEMRGRCTVDVICPAPKTTPYVVRVAGRTAWVDGTGYALDQGGRPRWTGVLLPGNVTLQGGAASGRFTVAAYNGGTSGNTASVTVTGNIGTPVNAATNEGSVPGESFGLFSQGDIVLDPGTCPTLVHGVLISGSGTLTIGRHLTTSSPPTTLPANGARCGRLTLSGAMASNVAPVLSYRWPSQNLTVGFSERVYVWDKGLRTAPPPFTPSTGGWEIAEWRDADISCTDSNPAVRQAANCS